MRQPHLHLSICLALIVHILSTPSFGSDGSTYMVDGPVRGPFCSGFVVKWCSTKNVVAVATGNGQPRYIPKEFPSSMVYEFSARSDDPKRGNCTIITAKSSLGLWLGTAVDVLRGTPIFFGVGADGALKRLGTADYVTFKCRRASRRTPAGRSPPAPTSGTTNIFRSEDHDNGMPAIARAPRLVEMPWLAPQRQTPPASLVPHFARTGVITSSGLMPMAPLQIRTRVGHDYFVRLVDAYSRGRVMEIYITGGDTFEGKVPLGNFEIRYASGPRWCGPVNLFGPETVYSKADRNFRFEEREGKVRGYTIELILQSGGNLRTSRIDKKDF
jgi:hypothetical protein